jgi:hypothetical protein
MALSNGATLALRFIWYLLSRLLIGAAIVGLVVLSFFVAMDYMNVQTLVKDGLHVRADVILTGADTATLSKVFSKSFLENDALLTTNAYDPYDVKSYSYSADVGFSVIFPWNKTAKVRVTEEVTGIHADLYATTDTTLSETPPDWVNAVYEVTLVRYEDNWRIVQMEQLEVLPSPTPSVTPTPSPSPSATPTGTPEAQTSEVIEE